MGKVVQSNALHITLHHSMPHQNSRSHSTWPKNTPCPGALVPWCPSSTPYLASALVPWCPSSTPYLASALVPWCPSPTPYLASALVPLIDTLPGQCPGALVPLIDTLTGQCPGALVPLIDTLTGQCGWPTSRVRVAPHPYLHMVGGRPAGWPPAPTCTHGWSTRRLP